MSPMAPVLALRTATRHACRATPPQARAVHPVWGGAGSTRLPDWRPLHHWPSAVLRL